MPQGEDSANRHDVAGVGRVTQEVITKAFAELKEGAAVRAEGGKSWLFFPNGIELFEVSVGLTGTGFEVKLKIAGEKGIKSLELKGEADPAAGGQG